MGGRGKRAVERLFLGLLLGRSGLDLVGVDLLLVPGVTDLGVLLLLNELLGLAVVDAVVRVGLGVLATTLGAGLGTLLGGAALHDALGLTGVEFVHGIDGLEGVLLLAADLDHALA